MRALLPVGTIRNRCCRNTRSDAAPVSLPSNLPTGGTDGADQFIFQREKIIERRLQKRRFNN